MNTILAVTFFIGSIFLFTGQATAGPVTAGVMALALAFVHIENELRDRKRMNEEERKGV